MTNRGPLQIALLICAVLGLFGGCVSFAQEIATGRAVVTAVTKNEEGLTTVPQQSVTLLVNGKRRETSGWVPLRGPRAGLQLVLLLDDASRRSLSLQLNDIGNFIRALPVTSEIAISYMRNGSANLVVQFTTDHASAVKALRMPTGTPGINGSPYFCLSDLIKRWPDSGQDPRREVIMLTDGVDRYSGRSFDPENPYVQSAIKDAQKAGVIVYSIYYRGAGGFDRGVIAANGGQNYLYQVSDSTGGKAYTEGFGNPVSLAPFLSDIQHRLQNQYELSFASTAEKGLQRIAVKTSQPNTKLRAPQQVLVSASPVQQ